MQINIIKIDTIKILAFSLKIRIANKIITCKIMFIAIIRKGNNIKNRLLNNEINSKIPPKAKKAKLNRPNSGV